MRIKEEREGGAERGRGGLRGEGGAEREGRGRVGRARLREGGNVWKIGRPL